MSYNLIVTAKSGNFLKNYDTFNKMDPFLKVTFGNDMQKTDVCQAGGKTPVWKKVLTFPVSVTQTKNLNNLTIMFEAFDEDITSDEWIGYVSLKLGEFNLNTGQDKTINLMDKANALVGTVTVGVQLKQDTPVLTEEKTPQKPQAKRLIGTVVVRPFSGKFEAASNLNDNQQVYLAFSHGDTTYKTQPSEGSGRRPNFNGILTFQEYDNGEMTVRCYENSSNKLIADGIINIEDLRSHQAQAQGHLVKLTDANKRFIGELNIEFEFLPDVFNNPVQLFATVAIKKGETIDKKVKYSNSEKIKKTLKVRSGNPNLILVKNETISVNPGESGEIKFKFLAPVKNLEEICKVDVLNEESRIEETLLFRVRAI